MIDVTKLLETQDPIARDNILSKMLDDAQDSGTLMATDIVALSAVYGLSEIYRQWFDHNDQRGGRFQPDYTFYFRVLPDDSAGGRLEFTKPGEFWHRKGLKSHLLDMKTRTLIGATKRTIDFWAREFARTKDPRKHPETIDVHVIDKDGLIKVSRIEKALELAFLYTSVYYDHNSQTPLLEEVSAADYAALKKRKSRKSNATPQKTAGPEELDNGAHADITENGAV